MLTKENFAKGIIYKFIKSEKLNNKIDFKELNKYVPQCTSLGIALEYLGLLNDAYKDYINERSGGAIVNTIDVFIENKLNNLKEEELNDEIMKHMLTTRDLFNLLPE